MIRIFLSLFMPGGLLLAAALFLISLYMHEVWTPILLKLFPIAVLGAGVFFGWRFNRSRLVFAVALLFLADRLLGMSEPGKILSSHRSFVFTSVSILLPINLAILSLLKERGIFTVRGILRICFILILPAILFLVYHFRPEILNPLLFQPIPGISFFSSFILKQQAVIAFFISLILVALVYSRQRGTFEMGFFWAIIAVLFALIQEKSGAAHLLLSTAGLMLIAAVIESAYGMAFRDELTGLPARRALNESFLKLPGCFTVAMLDIDFFKKFNDTFGHDVGDQVLCMVASRISKVSGGGKAFRFGGEEFTVLFPGKTVEDALPHLEFLREKIAETDFIVRGSDRKKNNASHRRKQAWIKKTASVTVSIGVAGQEKGKPQPQAMIKAADNALYKAKKQGRNRVVAG
ncbi:MAG: diguanylate cyclase [Proteobacteria bacterium]|nr:diguanylate cyclase [Pseudomonadota bacterium]